MLSFHRIEKSKDANFWSVRYSNDEWAVQRARYMTLEIIAPLSDDYTIKLPMVAA